MPDPTLQRIAREAQGEDKRQQRLRENAQGAALALEQMPASELVILSGQVHVDQVRRADEINPGVTLTIHGIGNPREYRITLPGDWIDQIHTALHAEPEEMVITGDLVDAEPEASEEPAA